MSERQAQRRPPSLAARVGKLRAHLMRSPPFSRMAPAEVEQFVEAARPAHFAAGAVVIDPAAGPATDLIYIVEGSVTGRRGLADVSGPIEYAEDDLFPVGAVLGQRAVTATYTANEDTDCLLVPAAQVQELAGRSPAFADYLHRRVLQFFDLSQKAVQAAWSSQSLTEQSLESPLSSLPRKAPLTCAALTPLQQALTAMNERRVGSVLIVDARGAPQGILTRHDILGRVTLPQRPLTDPIGEVMSAPIRSLTTAHTLQDAALLMSRHAIRHVPVTEDGRVVNIVSERDLFALHRLSLKQVSSQIRAAHDLGAFQQAAAGIRRLARHLLGQGVHARQLTQLVSRLNDLLTETLVEWRAAKHEVDLGRTCWLAFGSEGRSEQTVATDQDNGLIFASDSPDADRPRWLAFAADVNDALDACGYPLCKGNVMASNPACCLTGEEWAARFTHWIQHGAPEDLLNASIYFDFRPLVGNAELVQPLRTAVHGDAAPPPRFMRQLAENALRQRAPLNWLGGIDAKLQEGQRVVDLKLGGTAIFVDAARIFALAHGLDALGTRERIEAAAPLLKVPEAESQSWVAAFEFLQMLRLRVQLQREQPAGTESLRPAEHDANPNLLDIDSLNDLDRRLLKETLRVARRVQQRIELDWMR